MALQFYILEMLDTMDSQILSIVYLLSPIYCKLIKYCVPRRGLRHYGYRSAIVDSYPYILFKLGDGQIGSYNVHICSVLHRSFHLKSHSSNQTVTSHFCLLESKISNM